MTYISSVSRDNCHTENSWIYVSNKSTNQMERNRFSSLLFDIYSYVQLNMFRSSSRPSSGAEQLQ
jgi:hypothetical protein